MAAPETTVQEQGEGRWRPGQSGNPKGRPVGARNRATVLAETMLANDVGAIVRTVIDKALAGDVTCLRLCLERLVPPVRERPLTLSIPRVATADDAASAISTLVSQVAAGAISPGEAAAFASVVETFRKTVETQELERRVAALETNRGTR